MLPATRRPKFAYTELGVGHSSEKLNVAKVKPYKPEINLYNIQ